MKHNIIKLKKYLDKSQDLQVILQNLYDLPISFEKRGKLTIPKIDEKEFNKEQLSDILQNLNKSYRKEKIPIDEDNDKKYKKLKQSILNKKDEYIFLEDGIEILNLELIFALFSEVEAYIELCYNALDLKYEIHSESEKVKSSKKELKKYLSIDNETSNQ